MFRNLARIGARLPRAARSYCSTQVIGAVVDIQLKLPKGFEHTKQYDGFVRVVRGGIETVSFRAPANENDLNNKELYPWAASDKLVRLDCVVEADLLIAKNESDPAQESNPTLLTCSDFKESNVVFDDSNCILSAFVLPEGMVWPSFGKSVSKQDKARGRRVLCVRGARHAVGAVNATMEHLREGKKVAWVGLPGIGKSSSLSHLLLEYLQHMGEVGWYDNVLVRIGSTLLCFSYDQTTTNQVTVYSADCDDLADTESLCNKIYRMRLQQKDYNSDENDGTLDVVLLLELREMESDPEFALPFFTSASSREAQKTLVSLMKGHADIYLRDPHSFPELYFMREILHITTTCAGLPSRLQLREYAGRVGNLPRFLLSADTHYSVTARCGIIDSSASKFFILADRLDVWNIPDYMKFFAAPYVRKGVRYPLVPTYCALEEGSGEYVECNWNQANAVLLHEFRFLSDDLCRTISKIVKDSAGVEAMEKYGFFYQWIESIVREAIIKYKNPKCALNPLNCRTVEEWKILRAAAEIKNEKKMKIEASEEAKTRDKGVNGLEVQDGAGDGNIVTGMKLFAACGEDQEADLLSALEQCVSHTSFPAQYLSKPVTELCEDTVYSSSLVNGAVYDLLVVNHKQRMVYLFQTTSQSAKGHAIKPSTVRNVLDGLSMQPGQAGADYRIAYILMRPNLPENTITNPRLYIQPKDGKSITADEMEMLRYISCGFVISFKLNENDM